jgi:hypothetical protein
MKRKHNAIKGLVACAAMSFLSPAQAAVTLPSGDTFLNGTLEFSWASNGSARIDPALYVGGDENFPTGLDTVYLPPGNVTAGTGLQFDYSIAGMGTDQFSINYRIMNDTGKDWHNLRFIADVSGDPFDPLKEIPSVNWPAAVPGDPDNSGVDDFFAGDLFVVDILNDGDLDGIDHCGGVACEAEGALQWNLAILSDGAFWNIDILLSDAGASLSDRWIAFDLADAAGVVLAPAETLMFSGTATTVPVPASVFLVGGALPLVGLFRRARCKVASR